MKSIFAVLVILSSLFPMVEAQSNPHYTVTDPAIRDMLISMDMPRNTGDGSFKSMTTDPAIREMLISMNMPRYAGNVPAEIIAGTWQLGLSDGTHIELALLQSGSAIFGKGTMVNNAASHEAFASGSVSGSSLNLEVVAESATELYAISVDISSLPYKGTYVVFRPDSTLQTGTIMASKNPNLRLMQ